MALKRALLPLICVVLLLTSCPKRQTSGRLVYVATPPPASAPDAAQSTESIVIEEPESAEPEAKTTEAGAAQDATPKRVTRRRRPGTAKTDAPADSDTELPAEPPSPPAAEVPALEPQATPERQAQLRREISAAQEDAQKRITQLDHVQLGAGDRKTLDDARAFLAQSGRELERGELVRSVNLARKAALLVSAVEQSH